MSNRVGSRVLRGVVMACLLAGLAAAPSAAVAAPTEAEVAQAAQTNGMSEAEVRAILADKTSRLDKSGRIFYVDARPAEIVPEPPVAEGPYPYAQTFLLHSKPGSNRVIYLDFNGHTIQNTAWNGTFGSPVGPFFAEEFSLDASAAFSTAEQDIVQSVWQRVAEDYAPFNVDVTTQDPGLAALDRTNAADLNFGVRALITDAPEIGSTCGCGGIAYVGVFDAVAPDHERYQPAFTFPENLGSSAKNIAEATSHEVGHNLALSHDGTSAVGYYTGHGAWAPIMGVGYNKPIVQWSKGQYADANQTQDDLAIMNTRGTPLNADDVGNTTGTALFKGIGPTMTHSGIISTDADIDMFRITANAGASTFSVAPAPNSPNLDALVRVYNSAGTSIAFGNPPSAFSTFDVATGLSASVSVNLPAAGTYYVSVEGVAFGNPLNTGYSGYASLGRYTLSGVWQSSGPPPNNNFAAASLVSGASGTAYGTTANATKEAGEPNHAGFPGGKSIWYRWTAPASGSVTIDTIGSAFDTLLGVYTGTAVNALTVKAFNDNAVGTQSRVTFAATAGVVYRIAVDGKAAVSGPVTLHWSQLPPAPPNDTFGGTAIGGTSGTINGTTVNGTKQAGEPNHAGNAGGKSIWYTWTAPASGTLTLDTNGSAFDTLLAVYTGSAVNALTLRASDDDGGDGLQSRLTVAVTAGTVYRFAIDGYDGASGTTTMHWAVA